LSEKWIFDEKHYEALNEARTPVVRRVLSELKAPLGLRTAIDVGCGLGHFANVLHGMGLQVLGVDAREENVTEARRRYPNLRFEVADAEDPQLSRLGVFDVVFCFGLLYHLENPFRALRSLSVMTPKLVMVEGICYPSPDPILVLMDEVESRDQGLNYLAHYPSETGLVKMLRHAGCATCYLPSQMPAHAEYQEDRLGFRRRTILVASKAPLVTELLLPWPQNPPIHPWNGMLPLCPIRGNSGRFYLLLERFLHGRGQAFRRYS
jgi:SAM-dependent methyltransferase